MGKETVKFSDEDVYNTLINSNEEIQEELIKVVKINEKVVGKLYQYKFMLLKEWLKDSNKVKPNFYLSTKLVPSTDNKMANYWRNQSIQIGEDAIDFVFKRLFYINLGSQEDEFDKNFKELFDEDQIPTPKLFEKDSYESHLVKYILDYNRHGRAKKKENDKIIYEDLDYKTIKFLINNKEKIPNEYKFIFEKLNDLNKIQDEERRKEAIQEFLLIMTYSMYEDERLYDERGFNDRFYEEIFRADRLKYIDDYDPSFKEKVTDNEIIWIQKYQKVLNYDILYEIYKIEINFNYKEDVEYPEFKARPIVNYYFKKGKATHNFALNLLLNSEYRKLLKEVEDIVESLKPNERSYYYFLKGIDFNDWVSLEESQIEELFEDGKINDVGIKYMLEKYQVFENVDPMFFKDYYERNYNIQVFDPLLKQLDNNYYYMTKFLYDTLHKEKITEEDTEEICNMYQLNVLPPEKIFEIMKYIFFSDEVDRKEISKIIREGNFPTIIKIFLIISSDRTIKDLKAIIKHFEEYKELLSSVCNESLDEIEKGSLYAILINYDERFKGKINTLSDLATYKDFKYQINQDYIVKNNSKYDIKNFIFKSLFNMSSDDIDTLRIKYLKDEHFAYLKENIHNEESIKILDEYEKIIQFILSINNLQDLNTLKIIANNINKIYESDDFRMLFNIWNGFSKMNSDIMRICGSEINEKITIFHELLNMEEKDIPIVDGEKAFKISNLAVSEDFEYDGINFSKGKEIKMIELNGLPFVSLGHVLNAFGNGGKLSDFNHPRVIGSTHLCLTAIDDNYYELVQREENGIDYVQVLFDRLPAESLAIVSKEDAYSETWKNNLYVASILFGSYEPIRKVIAETFHGEDGFNEYVYYRQYSNDMQALKPSAILIRKDKPTKSEIQAATYLNVPLVKINREKYPVKTKEEMEKRDIELQRFYEELYKSRNKKTRLINLDELKKLKEQIMNLSISDEMNKGRRLA